MIYANAKEWRQAKHKRVLLFGMSGLGKTYLSNMLRAAGDWYHYSIDYRIGTRYMGEHIVDNFKREAMHNPLLRELLMSDSISIGSKITFNNLAPLSTYLGKPGDPAKGGLDMATYKKRQTQHQGAEVASLLDTPRFIERATDIYGYDHFVCDSGGSICEVVSPEDPNDPVLRSLSQSVLMVWIKGSEAHTDELIRRFDAAPKPMCYLEDFLDTAWRDYLDTTDQTETQVDPDAFVRWTYARALAYRQPRYKAMAQQWGVTVSADDVATVKDVQGFEDLIAAAL